MTKSNALSLPAKNNFLRYLFDAQFSTYRRIFLLLALLVFFFFLVSTPEKGYTTRSLFLQKAGFFIALFGPIGLNLYVLIPKYLFKNRYRWYFLALTGTYAFFYPVSLLFEWVAGPTFISTKLLEPSISLVYGFLTYLTVTSFFCAATAAWKLFQRWLHDSYWISELESNLLRAELDLLKTNISPHFLFNMLNNAEVLTRTDPPKASQLLIKLADFLRYQLYDSSRESVLLSADIRFLDHFLTLEKIRRDQFDYSISQAGTDQQIKVPPLLFIPFVENAVKHNLVSCGAYVHLSFVLRGKELIFTCQNSVDSDQTADIGGFGLPTVYRRLDLLYPGMYRLDIDERLGSYSVTLAITL